MAKRVLYRGYTIREDRVATFINRHEKLAIFIVIMVGLLVGAIGQHI